MTATVHERFLSHAWQSQTVICCVYQIAWTVTNHIRKFTEYITAIIFINVRFRRPSGFCLHAAGKQLTVRRQHGCKRNSEYHCRVSGHNVPYVACATESGRGKATQEGEKAVRSSNDVHNCPQYSNLLFILCFLCTLLGTKELVIFLAKSALI